VSWIDFLSPRAASFASCVTAGRVLRNLLALPVLDNGHDWLIAVMKMAANPVRLGAYTGRAESASGCFVCEAVEALQPTAAWIAEHEAAGAHMRAAIMTRPPGDRVQAVHSAMQGYVAASSSPFAER